MIQTRKKTGSQGGSAMVLVAGALLTLASIGELNAVQLDGHKPLQDQLCFTVSLLDSSGLLSGDTRQLASPKRRRGLVDVV